MGQKQHRMSLKCLRPFFDLVKIVKIFNFCVFHPILMKFGMAANIGQKTT